MAKNDFPKVFLIILNWNGKDDTLECLTSVRQISYPSLTTVVVDNGSTDTSIAAITEQFPEIEFLLTGSNLGYAEGNNVGMRYAIEHGADYIFILNNDTTVASDLISALVTEAEKHPETAIFAPKIYFYDRADVINSAGGYIDYHTLSRGHIGYGVKEDGATYSQPQKVEWATGCALFLRVSALHKTGLFDPEFFLICEELDLCTRTRRLGYDIRFVPDAKVWHKVSAAFEGNYSPTYCYYMFRNIFKYARKNFPTERFSLYRKLFRETKDFYQSLERADDSRARKKGFCMMMGIFHFFTGVSGQAPAWVFKVNFNQETLAEKNRGKDLFKASITIVDEAIEGSAGTTVRLPVSVKNESEGIWPAFTSDAVRLSYHLRDEHGKTVAWDGVRTTLPGNLEIGKEVALQATVQLPAAAGNYIVEWDLVQESVAWFSTKGNGAPRQILLVL